MRPKNWIIQCWWPSDKVGVQFLVDAQLPPALARWLTEAGHPAQHVEEAGLREAEDPPIWDYALKQRAVLLTTRTKILRRE